jgi:hypothetical protein
MRIENTRVFFLNVCRLQHALATNYKYLSHFERSTTSNYVTGELRLVHMYYCIVTHSTFVRRSITLPKHLNRNRQVFDKFPYKTYQISELALYKFQQE